MLSDELSQWSGSLASALAQTLVAYRSRVDELIERLVVDCHPWNGLIEMSLLGHAEVASDPLLADITEIAAWKHFNFGSQLPAWQTVRELGLEMKRAYEVAQNRRPVVSDDFFRACATALAMESVQSAISQYPRSDGFKISVPHPDDGREFYTGPIPPVN